MNSEDTLQIKVNNLLQLEIQKIMNQRKQNAQIIKSNEQNSFQSECKQTETTEKLTEDAKQFITLYIQEHKQLKLGDLTFRMNSKFKNMNARNDIKQFIAQQLNNKTDYNVNQPELSEKLNENKEDIKEDIQEKEDQSGDQYIKDLYIYTIKTIQNTKLSSLTFKANTKIYKTVLQNMSNADHSMKTPFEICVIINSMKNDQLESFWKYLQNYSSNLLENNKQYFYETYCRLVTID
ncbi:Hypothetical_protein [Hexamita inflata]|uniref:Hypothetical_protein n=1 Tax=Hexamita inflata TaxID=28002 RepID=A0AA86R7W6_9EUKA|nr:Hypothetical protein HINF_LOCUS55447 [Hexamita inflata]